jgi:NADH-quinone oxidoreductase E subunit
MPIAFSPQALQKIAQIRSRYPDAQAACLPVLHLAQDEFGYLPDEALKLVAEALGLPEAHVFGVVTFYTMFHRKPAGKNVLMVCTNVSCMLTGGYRVLDQVCQSLGVKPGETTADGQVTVVEEECLAACADAPMAICDRQYYLRLDAPEKVEKMLSELRARGAGAKGSA